MPKTPLYFYFVLLLSIFKSATAAQLINCPTSNIKYEKVLGLRPSSPQNHPLLLHQEKTPFAAITQPCIEKCDSMSDCLSFAIHYNVSTCYWFKSSIQGVQELDNVLDSNTAWFIKTCFNVENCDKIWIFERVPGATLIGNNTKTLPQVTTRTECQQACLDETNFPCLSAKFKIKSAEYGPNEETKGVCTLSSSDRRISLNSYRVSSFEDEYFENQCTNLRNDTNSSEFCAYEEYDNATLIHTDLIYSQQTKNSCQELCEEYQEFNCRGFSLVNNKNGEFDCKLHSEDTKVHGPKLLYENPLGKYYERAQCINISLTCTETYMTVNFAPKMNFKGKLYMDGYSEQTQCFAQGQGFEIVKLKLPLLSSQCGIIKARAPYNRTLLTGTMILQYNPLIQTQGDRAIRVGCIYGNDSTVLVGTGITITPSSGSTLLNDTNSASPTVEMRVLDLNTLEEVSNTQIGQELQLSIEIKPANNPYDIWVGHLVAMTEKSDESILLLDDRGCPTNIDIFPPLTKIKTNETRKLISNFQAFKFSTSPIVRFSVIVQFCSENCPSVDCGSDIESFGRRKREIVTHTLETANGTTVVSVNRSEFEKGSVNGHHLPLEFIMIVRNGTPSSDRLIVSDGKVLVAGYDYSTSEVCLNYSLFIGMIVTWVLIQIVFVVCSIILIKRYKNHYEKENARQSMEELHKNFGIGFSNLENRRVHWADNGDYT